MDNYLIKLMIVKNDTFRCLKEFIQKFNLTQSPR